MNSAGWKIHLTAYLKFQWVVWGLCVATVLIGTVVMDLSSGKSVALELVQGKKVVFEQFRPVPHAVNLYLQFNRANSKDKRPELGDYRTRYDWEKTGFLEFEKPGAPIKLKVRGEKSEVIYEALPASSYSKNTQGRDLVPFVDDGIPARIPWPPNNSLRAVLPVGFSVVEIEVFEIGVGLEGEQATLIVLPPVSFKSTAPGYGLLWWFMFSPVYAVVLVFYGAVLLWSSVRTKGAAPEAESSAPDN